MRVSFGYGGWVGVDQIGLPGPLYLRLRLDGERLRVAEFYLDSSEGPAAISQQDLRVLPLTRIELFVNAEPNRDNVVKNMGRPAPDLSTLASYFRTVFANWQKHIDAHDWVATSFAAQIGDEGIPKVARPRRISREWQGISQDADFRLERGPDGGLTDDFLADVSRAYAAAVARGERPNLAMSEQTGAPVKSVQRWVYLARLRGLMPRSPGKGKVG